MKRKKFLSLYYILFIILSCFIFFGLKNYSQKKFSQQSLIKLISGNPKFKDITNKLCTYQILGEPDVQKNYVKINFWCNDNTKAKSTFSLKAFDDKTFTGIISEYSRIIGFDSNILQEKNWYCTVNDKELSINSNENIIEPASTIDCFETKGLIKHD
jgi:hypothetical protein